MREITLEHRNFVLKEKVIELLERTVKPVGTSGKVDVPKRHMGKRAYVLILED